MNSLSIISGSGYLFKTSFILMFIGILFFANNSFCQTVSVNPPTQNFKPDKKSDACVECLCITLQASLDFANLSETYATPGVPGVNSGYKTKVGFNIGAFASKSI